MKPVIPDDHLNPITVTGEKMKGYIQTWITEFVKCISSKRSIKIDLSLYHTGMVW